MNDSCHSSEFFDINRYSVFRYDRDFVTTNTTRGGGVLLALSKEYTATKISTNSICDKLSDLYSIDIVLVQIKFKFHYLYVLVIYIPPSTKSDEYERLVDSLVSLYCLYGSDILVVGDFNLTEYARCEDVALTSTSIRAIHNFSNFFELNQYNHVPNTDGRTLDLVFCNRPCSVCKASEVLLKEDNYHPAISIQTNFQKSSNTNFPHKNNLDFNFKEANFVELYRELELTDWSCIECFDDVDMAVDALYSKLYDIFQIHVPKKQKSSGSYPTWFNRQIIHDIKQNEKALKRYKVHGNAEDKNIFSRLRSKINSDIYNAYKLYLANVENNILSNPNNFWSFIKAKNNSTSTPSSLTYENQILEDPQLIVDSFAHYFSKSFTPPQFFWQ